MRSHPRAKTRARAVLSVTLVQLVSTASLVSIACDSTPQQTAKTTPAPQEHRSFVTRRFRVFCGKPEGSTLSAYAAAKSAGEDLDDAARGPLTRRMDRAATGCVPADRAAAIERRLGDMVDHFDRWGIRPQMPVFGPEGAPFYRLYVHALANDNTAFADSWVPPRSGADDTVSHVNADVVQAFGTTRPIDSVHYFLAHEMTHVMQRWSTAIAGAPASASGDARRWVTEGMADAVGLRLLREATGHWRVDGDPTLVRTPTGLRSYARPLPATDKSYKTIGEDGAKRAKADLDDYRTSSLFTFMMERYGNDDPAFFAELLAVPSADRTATATDWVGWLDKGSRRATQRSLADVYRAFIPHFASWGFTRYYRFGLRGAKATEAAYQPAQWLVEAFGECVKVELNPDAKVYKTITIPAMTARCISLTFEAPASRTTRLEIVATGAPAPVLAGLGLGLARTEGGTTWECAAQGSKTDCEVPGATTSSGPPLVTWTTDPLPLNAEGRGSAIVTLASFPNNTSRQWLDRTDTLTLEFGLRSTIVASSVPSPSPPQHTSAAGPLTGAITAVAHRGARPALPLDAAALPGTAPAWLDAIFRRPGLLGTTGVTAEALADAPAGLPGLALYTYAPGDPTPARVFVLVFGQPVPLGFSGVTAGYVTGTIDPRRAPPQLVGPPDGKPVPVAIEFTKDRLALSLAAPLCLADLDRLGTSPDPAAIADAMCVARGSLEAAVSLPFGEYYVLGAAPPVDPESVRYEPLGGSDEGSRVAAEDGGEGRGDRGGGVSSPAAGAAALTCACTCEWLAAWRAEGNQIAEEAARVAADLDLSAMAAGATIPPRLSARMEAHEALTPCLDRCVDVFATCE